MVSKINRYDYRYIYYTLITDVFSTQLIIVFFTYYFLFEVIFNRTIGKLITCTIVRSKLEYKRVGFWRIFLRSICRLIPFEFISYISKKPFGLHDQLSGTVVINSIYNYSAFYKRFKSTSEGFIRLSWVISILIGLPTFGIGFITYWILARLVLWIKDGYSEDHLKNQQ